MIEKIQTSNPKMGFRLGDELEALLYFKWLYWSKGLSTRVFKSELVCDIKDVIDLDNAFKEKELREKDLSNMMRNIKW